MSGTLNDQVRDSLEPILDKITDIICTQIESQEDNIPVVEYREDDDGDECLYIDGIEVARHRRLYIMDILSKLDSEEIIKLVTEGDD